MDKNLKKPLLTINESAEQTYSSDEGEKHASRTKQAKNALKPKNQESKKVSVKKLDSNASTEECAISLIPDSFDYKQYLLRKEKEAQKTIDQQADLLVDYQRDATQLQDILKNGPPRKYIDLDLTKDQSIQSVIRLKHSVQVSGGQNQESKEEQKLKLVVLIKDEIKNKTTYYAQVLVEHQYRFKCDKGKLQLVQFTDTSSHIRKPSLQAVAQDNYYSKDSPFLLFNSSMGQLVIYNHFQHTVQVVQDVSSLLQQSLQQYLNKTLHLNAHAHFKFLLYSKHIFVFFHDKKKNHRFYSNDSDDDSMVSDLSSDADDHLMDEGRSSEDSMDEGYNFRQNNLLSYRKNQKERNVQRKEYLYCVPLTIQANESDVRVIGCQKLMKVDGYDGIKIQQVFQVHQDLVFLQVDSYQKGFRSIHMYFNINIRNRELQQVEMLLPADHQFFTANEIKLEQASLVQGDQNLLNALGEKSEGKLPQVTVDQFQCKLLVKPFIDGQLCLKMPVKNTKISQNQTFSIQKGGQELAASEANDQQRYSIFAGLMSKQPELEAAYQTQQRYTISASARGNNMSESYSLQPVGDQTETKRKKWVYNNGQGEPQIIDNNFRFLTCFQEDQDATKMQELSKKYMKKGFVYLPYEAQMLTNSQNTINLQKFQNCFDIKNNVLVIGDQSQKSVLIYLNNTSLGFVLCDFIDYTSQSMKPVQISLHDKSLYVLLHNEQTGLTSKTQTYQLRKYEFLNKAKCSTFQFTLNHETTVSSNSQFNNKIVKMLIQTQQKERLMLFTDDFNVYHSDLLNHNNISQNQSSNTAQVADNKKDINTLQLKSEKLDLNKYRKNGSLDRRNSIGKNGTQGYRIIDVSLSQNGGYCLMRINSKPILVRKDQEGIKVSSDMQEGGRDTSKSVKYVIVNLEKFWLLDLHEDQYVNKKFTIYKQMYAQLSIKHDGKDCLVLYDEGDIFYIDLDSASLSREKIREQLQRKNRNVIMRLPHQIFQSQLVDSFSIHQIGQIQLGSDPVTDKVEVHSVLLHLKNQLDNSDHLSLINNAQKAIDVPLASQSVAQPVSIHKLKLILSSQPHIKTAQKESRIILVDSSLQDNSISIKNISQFHPGQFTQPEIKYQIQDKLNSKKKETDPKKDDQYKKQNWLTRSYLSRTLQYRLTSEIQMQVGDAIPSKKLLKVVSKQYESTTKELDAELMMEYLVAYKWFDFGNMFHLLADNMVLFPQLMMAVEGMAGQIPADQAYLYKNIVDQSPLSIAIQAKNTGVVQQIVDAIKNQTGGALEEANLKLLENNFSKLVDLQFYYKDKEEIHNVLKLDELLASTMIYANYNDRNLPRRGQNIINVTLIDKHMDKSLEKEVVYEKADFGIIAKQNKGTLFEREIKQEIYEEQDNQMVVYKQVKSQELLSTQFLESVYQSRYSIQLNMVPYLRQMIHAEYELGRRFRMQRMLINVIITMLQASNINLIHVQAPADNETYDVDTMPFGRQNASVVFIKLLLLVLNCYIGYVFLKQNYKANYWALGIFNTPQIQMSFFFIIAYFLDNQIEVTNNCMIAYALASGLLFIIMMLEFGAFHRQSNLYVSLIRDITWEMRYLLAIYAMCIICQAYIYYMLINDNSIFGLGDIVYTIQTTFGYLGPLQDENDNTMLGSTVEVYWIMNIILFPILFYNLFISNVMKIHQAAVMDDENRYLRLKLAFIIEQRKANGFNPDSMYTRMPIKRDGEENLQMMALMAMMDPTGGMMSGMDAAGQMAMMGAAGAGMGGAGAGAGGAEIMAMQSEVKKVVDKLEALQDSIERLERL